MVEDWSWLKEGCWRLSNQIEAESIEEGSRAAAIKESGS